MGMDLLEKEPLVRVGDLDRGRLGRRLLVWMELLVRVGVGRRGL